MCVRLANPAVHSVTCKLRIIDVHKQECWEFIFSLLDTVASLMFVSSVLLSLET